MNFNTELINAYFGQSLGQPKMSDLDVKMTLLSLRRLVECQGFLIHDLIEMLAEEPKKKFWQFWK